MWRQPSLDVIRENKTAPIKQGWQEHRTKTIPPEPNRLMANIDAAFVQKVFHISKRERKPDIHHHSQADDFGARLEVLEWVAFCHPVTLGVPLAHFNQLSSDSAVGGASGETPYVGGNWKSCSFNRNNLFTQDR
jgi:hypothetical protein